MPKITIIHHSADFDGLFCCEIARRRFGADAEYIGWDFGDAPLPFPDKDTHYIVLDLPMDRPFGLRFEDGWLARDNALMEKEHRQIQPIDRIDFSHWAWIDHHKSSIDTHPTQIPGYRIDGVAACRLAWQYFGGVNGWEGREIPTKQDFIDRMVNEPWAVRLAGEYDIWDKRDPNAELFQHGLRSRDLGLDWTSLLRDDGILENGTVRSLLEAGKSIQYSKTQENAGIIASYGFDVKFEGLKFLACNHARFNSHLFTAGVKPEHDALLGFNWDGHKWRVSLYHAAGKERHDLSLIASKYGGGGHRGACGFRVDELPFML